MQFFENDTPVFTERNLDHLERYRASYGEDFFSPDAIAHQREQVKVGRPSLRCGVNSKCFEVMHEGQHIGDIALILNNVAEVDQPAEDRYELDLMMFHEFSGQGLAKQALQEFLEFYKATYPQPLEALVRKANPLYEHVVHLLKSTGFLYEGDLGSDVVYLLKRNV